MVAVIEKNDYFYKTISINIDVTEDQKKRILDKFPLPIFPDGEATFRLEEEDHGNSISSVLLLLNDYRIEKASNGNQYLKFSFTNRNGSINAKMWDNSGSVDATIPLLEKYTLFHVSGKIEEFPRDSGTKSLTINKLIPCKEEINPFMLLPSTEHDMELLTIELFTYLNELEEPHRTVGLAGLKKFWKEFVIRPAAKGYHHNYLGGLLKHTVGLMRLARYILDKQESFPRRMMRLIQTVETEHKKEVWANFTSETPLNPKRLVWNGTIDHLYSIFNGLIEHKNIQPNKSLLICAILYHDIGKLLEYSHAGSGINEFHFLYPTAEVDSVQPRKQTGITMDPLGCLVGHMPYGVLLLSKVLENEGIKISMEDIHYYNHCILSHHGKHEWQSTVVPATVEAYLLHFVDYLDSRYEVFDPVK